MLIKLTICIFMAASINVFSASQAWVHVNGIGNKVAMKPVNKPWRDMLATNGNWIKGKEKLYVVAHSPKEIPEQWKQYGFSFIPQNNGVVYMYLSGLWLRPAGATENIPVWVAYDNITVEGAELQNGDFEALDPQGNLNFWRGKTKDSIVINSNNARSGKNYVIAWSGKQLEYALKVKKGVKVTVLLYAKASDGTDRTGKQSTP